VCEERDAVLKDRVLPFEVVSLAFADCPKPSQYPSTGGPYNYTAADLKRLSRQARTRSQFLPLVDFYQARRRMWVQRAIGELDRMESGELPEKVGNPEAISTQATAHTAYQHHLRQAAKSAAHSLRYLRRADFSQCVC
jgi:hypothetical protein